ncbi:amidase [Streptomyces sp. NPDC047123]|uniref:amidase n=1 Tax=Streptomyces sp. NPDC047123 TaxID=3155622 RepID=UPI0033D77D37
MQPADLTLTQAATAIGARTLSPVELLDAVLERIERTEPHLNAYAAVHGEQARRAARTAADELAAGRHRGPLHGIPMGLKDLIDVAGTATGAGSRLREGHRADTDSTVAARLAAAGAVLLGKTHTHEFAYGLTTPQTHNARDPHRVAGGSSGGSAVAVAAGSATFALGTDTGGSIRVPAALNGVVGLKPTYGLVSRHGVTALSWSLDHVGPITRTVQDAALVLTELAGHDPRDPASVAAPRTPYLPGPDSDLGGLRVGVPRTYYFDRLAPDVEHAVRTAIDHLAGLGARLIEVDIPLARHVQAVQWGLMVPEATAYHEPGLRTAPDRYTPEVRALLEAGTLLSAGDYLRAQRARTLMRRAWAQLFTGIDVLAAPTVPATAVPAGQETLTWADGTTESVADAYVRLCAPADITGVPALTLPTAGDTGGPAVGLQLLARPFHEALLLRVGHAYEQTRPAPAPAPAA